MNTMNIRATPIIALATSVALLAAGCENMTPGENAAVFGGGAGILAGSLARAAGASTGAL